MTAEQYLDHAERASAPSELVRGEVHEMAPIGLSQRGRIEAVYEALKSFVGRHGLGRVMMDVGFVVEHDPDTVRGPDVAFVEADKLPHHTSRSFLQGAPRLAVEVTKATVGDSGLQAKVEEYFRAGAARVWVVWLLSNSVTVYSAPDRRQTFEGDDVLTSEEAGFKVPGFSLRVADIFAE